MELAKSQNKHLLPLSWGTLIFLLGVILWGSFVRASGSGAGCGNHWPLCNGQVLPQASSWKTIVEFTHRLSSGLSVFLCGAVCFLSFREGTQGSLIRKGGVATLLLIFSEAIIGAGLVLLRLVERDESALRAVSMSIHLLNTFLLLAAVTLTAHWAWLQRKGTTPRLRRLELSDRIWAFLALLFVLILGASGAVTALGDTLYPVKTLAQGFSQDISPTRHFLISLRLYHPLIALSVSLYLILYARRVIRAGGAAAFHAVLLIGLQCAQLLLGFLNVLLLAPLAVQMLHLFMSDLIWINLVWMVSTLFVGTSVAAE